MSGVTDESAVALVGATLVPHLMSANRDLMILLVDTGLAVITPK